MARSSEVAERGGFPAALLAAFRSRAWRGALSLNSLDDRLLKDIGLNRGDVMAASLGFEGEAIHEEPAAGGRPQPASGRLGDQPGAAG